MIHLKNITILDKPIFDEKISNNYENSESSFANIFIWRNNVKTRFAIINDFLCIFYIKKNGNLACCFPYGKGNLKTTFEMIKDYFDSQNSEFIMESVAEENLKEIIEIYNDKIIYEEDKDLNDYVYNSEKLINLSGKKLHSKRNHINKFKQLYNYEYKELTSDLFEMCLNKCNEWLLEKYQVDDQDYLSEMTAMNELFSNYEKLDLKGGTIFVDDELVAFTVGEKLNINTFVTHIEKANTNFQGAYAIINNEFAKNECENYEFINREEDMGIEGLRKAKSSYYPDKIIRKYSIKFRSEN